MENIERRFIETLNRVLNKAIAKEAVPRKLDSGELLYRTEIHIIDVIGTYPETNITGLAERLGVTKGAVSQKVRLLEKKLYIARYKSFDNNKEVYFALTEKGKKIFEGHREFHKILNSRIIDSVKGIELSDMEKIIKILGVMEKHFETL